MNHFEKYRKNVLTLGIFAHANAGKTTITEQILYHTGVIDSVGRVDSGNTITDSMQIERERGISVRASLVTFNISKKYIQLIDTPGHIDFSAEVERAITVLDGAILVVSGVESVEPQTYTIWKALKKRSIPTIIFINKMDRLGADYYRVIDDIRNTLEEKVCPIISIDKNIDETLILNNIGRNNFIEILADIDEEILKLYVENEAAISPKWIARKFTTLVRNGEIFPILGGSALTNVGIKELLDSINRFIPSYDVNNLVKKDFSGFVYLVRKENENRNLFTKILSGNISIRSTIEIASGNIQKVKGLFRVDGVKLVSIESAGCGEIVVINGLNSNSGNIIGHNITNITPITFINPLLVMQIEPKSKSKVIELVEALMILNDEDPYLNVRHNKLTGATYVNLMGVIQAETIQDMLINRFNLEVIFSNPLVVHKETPSIIGIGKASYTRFSGIAFEIRPLPSGSGLIYNSKFSTDYLHKKYQSQASRLINYYCKQGIHGWEITDLEISLVDGRFNSAGSSPSHFNIIVPIAFIRALKNSKMKILEPISCYSIIAPKEHLNALMYSIKNIGATFEIKKETNSEVVLEGEVPSSNILNYQSEIIKITSGRGVFASSLSRYELSRSQDIKMDYFFADPRNEVKFIMGEMGGSLDAMDIEFSKRKKASRSKFKRQQK